MLDSARGKFSRLARMAARPRRGVKGMVKIHYRVVQHDGGWAYRLGDVFSEPFPSHDAALAAARRVAAEQHVPGDPAYIEYQDAAGTWRTEASAGTDRPDADVIE